MRFHFHDMHPVQWTTDLGNLAVIFGTESPFKPTKLILTAEKFQTTDFFALKETGDPNAAKFKYAVAIFDGAKLHSEDPELEITDAGGGN